MTFYEEIIEREIFLKELNNLYQDKHNKKIYITDIAISKIPYVKFNNISNEKCFIVHELCEYLLRLAKNDNCSNEVALTYNLSSTLHYSDGIENIINECGICYGNEKEIDLFADTQTMSMINRSSSSCLINIHNHPSCFSFSLQDIRTFLKESAIRLMIVICNDGEMYYMDKTDKYNVNECYDYLKQIYETIRPKLDKNQIFNLSELREITNLFLKNCLLFGVDYRHVLNNNKEIIERLDK